LDTGCTGAAFPAALAESLKLPSAGTVNNFFGNGHSESLSYHSEIMFDLNFPDGRPATFKVTDLVATTMEVTEHFDMILGTGALRCLSMKFPANFAPFQLWHDYPNIGPN
jgi:hypothetical protein